MKEVKIKRCLKRAMTLLVAFAMVITSLCITGGSQADAAAKYVVSLKVAKAPASMKVGKTKKLKVTVKTKGKANKKFSVKSNNRAVVKAGVSGSKVKLSAKRAGTAKITVTSKGKGKKGKKLSKKFTVKVVGRSTNKNTNNNNTNNNNTNNSNNNGSGTGGNSNTGNTGTVTPTPEVITKVVVSADKTSINIGETVQLIAAAIPATVSTRIVWESANSSVALVDQNGRVTGLSSGTAEISAYADNGVVGKIMITVNAVAVTGVTLDITEHEMTEGSTTTLKETVEPANATNRNVTWTSSDPKVAVVDQKGQVTAVAEGTANIVVETVDGGQRATAVIHVTHDSSKDVNEMTTSVTNSLDGYQDVVLVGTQAKLNVKVMKNGKPYGGDSVNVRMEDVSGYTDYYELSSSDITLNNEGIGTVYVRLKSGKKYTPVCSDLRSDAAYASFKIVFTAGGATFKEEQTLSFAQVLPQTYNSLRDGDGKAVSVENPYDPELQDIKTTESFYAIGSAQNLAGYEQEYVIDQQVSSEEAQDGNHEVVLDAAPLLIRSDTLGGSASDEYSKVDIDYTKDEYSVYAGSEEGDYVLEKVPGGLKYLSLTFDKLKLSKYTRIVVRAYKEGTYEPLVNRTTGKLIEKVITDSTVISSETLGNRVQIENEIFGQTGNYREIDIRIFIESAGQVSEDDNIGFTLKEASGVWENAEIKSYDLVSMADCVTWTWQTKTYAAETDLLNPEDYLGDRYNSNNTYKYAMPAFPNIGNAIIVAYDSNGKATEYYLYPTSTTKDHNANELLAPDPDYLFKGTVDQIKALKEGDYQVEDLGNGKVKVDSKKAGYVQLQARVQVFETDSDQYAVDYKLDSFIQWSPNAGGSKRDTANFYAIAGQTVTLTATVTDKNGNIASNTEVDWTGTEDLVGVTADQTTGMTDSRGQVRMKLQSTGNAITGKIVPEVDSSRLVTWTVADTPVEDNTDAVIHWVKPGIYYKNTVDNTPDVPVEEYNTSDATTPITLRTPNQYESGTTWILGTKVVGADYDEVIDISNIEVGMTSSSSKDIPLNPVEKENGVCSVTSKQTGESEITVSINGQIDPNKKCVVTVVERGQARRYISVGEGDIVTGADLKIPINWIPNGVQLSFVNNNKTFDIKNDRTKKAVVYAKVEDKNNNPVPDKEIVYTVTNAAGTKIVEDTKAKTDEKGIVAIELDTPVAEDIYTIQAAITNDTTVTDYSANTVVTYSNKTEEFRLDKQEDVTTGGKEIILTFTTALNSGLMKLDASKKFFRVTDQGVEKDIASVEIVKGNTKQLKITTTEELSTKAVADINNIYTDPTTNYVYYLLDNDGVLYENNK